MKSMTGYGRGEAQGAEYCIIVEMRSVNHRYLEIGIRLPRQLNILEDALKKQVQSRLSRGKVDVFLNLDRTIGKKTDLVLDKELAIAYHNSLLQLSEITGLPLKAHAEDVAVFPGVLIPESAKDDVEAIAVLNDAALCAALDQMIDMREREGQSLLSNISMHVAQIEAMAHEIGGLVSHLLAEQQQKLRKRVSELLEDVAVDEARMANEIAFLVDRTDISEELARLGSHCSQFKESFILQEALGRRLDFLTQEMNREINTIGSKTNALIISNHVIEMKSALEKIREQVQNIE